MNSTDIKVLVITKAYPDLSRNYFGGSFVADQVKYLSRMVGQVDVLCNQSVLPPKKFFRKVLINNLTVNYNYYFPGYLFHRYKGDWIEHLTNIYYKSAKKIIENNNKKYDIIHAHFSHPCGSAAVKLGKEFGLPVVTTIHEDHEWLMQLIDENNPSFTSAWTNSDVLIRVNKLDRELLRKFNANTEYIPNGYDPENYYPIKSIIREKNRIFAMGMLDERKGYQDLIKSLYIIKKDFPDIKCIIAGKDVGYGKTLRELIDSLGLNNIVTLLGPISVEEARKEMNRCNIFCHPSKSESFGIVQIEAMACGTPVVATFNGGSELIIENDCGLLSHRLELPSTIKEALIKNWNHERIIDEVSRFNINNIVKMTIQKYMEAIEKVTDNDNI